jgi:pilus assembly protein CpaE
MSTAPIRTLVAVDASIDPDTVETILDDPGIEIVGVIEGTAAALGRDALASDVLLVACQGHSQESLDFIKTAIDDRPDRPVVVVYSGTRNGFVREFFERGADDIIVLDDSAQPGADTFFALQKAVARKGGAVAGAGDEGSLGGLITVLGPKGGIGKTLTSSNLGAALADRGQRVIVVDLDLQFGDLGLSLGLTPDRTIYDLATIGGTLDAAKVADYLVDHHSGARVLLAPTRPDQAASISVEFLRELYAILRRIADYVVVDTAPGFTPEVITTIDASTAIVMVGMLDAPSLKNTKLGLETLDLIGYPRDRLRMVLNRADTSVGITHADVVAVLGRAPDVLVPSHRDVVRSINNGEPITLSARKSEPGKAFQALAEMYVNDRAPRPTKRNGRGLPRLLGRT